MATCLYSITSHFLACGTHTHTAGQGPDMCIHTRQGRCTGCRVFQSSVIDSDWTDSGEAAGGRMLSDPETRTLLRRAILHWLALPLSSHSLAATWWKATDRSTGLPLHGTREKTPFHFMEATERRPLGQMVGGNCIVGFKTIDCIENHIDFFLF